MGSLDENFFPFFVIIFIASIWTANQYLNPTKVANPITPTTAPNAGVTNQTTPTPTAIPTITNIQPIQQRHSISRPGEGEGFEGE